MNKYYIKEYGSEITYIELRLLIYIDCEKKYEKINEILNFLKTHGFLVDLTMIYPEIGAEVINEREEKMSLTIDAPNEDRMRFKFWNGASTMWLFHTSDLFDSISMGREKSAEVYDKYEPVTEVLFDFKKKWSTSIYDISYKYPSDSDVDVIYNIVFTEEIKKNNSFDVLLKKINKSIFMLGDDIIKELNFKIEHSFHETGCSPCEQAKKEREQNESNRKNDK